MSKLAYALLLILFSEYIKEYMDDAFYRMFPFMILMLPLILTDLKFGLKAAKFRGDRVTYSSAARRTLNKVVEYICWLILAVTLNQAFMVVSENLICLVIMGGVSVIEVLSAINNYLEPKGMSLQLNWKELLGIKGLNIKSKKHDKKKKV